VSNGGWIDPQRYHTGALACTRLSPNGQLLVTASSDGTCKLWNVLSLRRDTDSMLSQSSQLARPSSLIPLDRPSAPSLNGEEAPLEFGYHGSLLFTFRHESSVTHVTFTDDSRFVITASTDATVKMWQISTGNQVYQVNLPYPVDDMVLLATNEIVPLQSIHVAPSSSMANLGTTSILYNPQSMGRLYCAIQNRVLVVNLTMLSPGGRYDTGTPESQRIAESQLPSRSVAFRGSRPAGLDANATPTSAALSTSRELVIAGTSAGIEPVHALPAVSYSIWPPPGSTTAPTAFPGLTSQRTRMLQHGITRMDVRRSIAHASLAPDFLVGLLHQCAQNEQSVDENQLNRNMSNHRLDATQILRVVASSVRYKPAQVLQALASDTETAHALYAEMAAGIDIDEILSRLGFLPINGSDDTRSVDPRRASGGKSNKRASGRGTFTTGLAAAPADEPFCFIKLNPMETNDGFFYSKAFSLVPMLPSSTTTTTSSTTTATTSSAFPGRVSFQPSRQLNLLNMILQQRSINDFHLQQALTVSSFPLFSCIIRSFPPCSNLAVVFLFDDQCLLSCPINSGFNNTQACITITCCQSINRWYDCE
jgi:hypothetical protein